MKRLSTGEMLVWALAYDRALSASLPAHRAVVDGADAVRAMRSVGDGSSNFDDESRAMLDDMLASGSGLWCASGALGVFEPGTAPCKRCGRTAIEHRSVR